MSEDVVIRPARPADAAAIAAIWWPGWQDAHVGEVPDELLAVRTESSFLARARHMVAETAVADVGGEVAGFVTVVEDEVEQLYVADEQRGRGVAALLLAEGERRVRAAGHPAAWLAVVGGNARARRFYERCGWRDGGPFDHAAPGPDGPISVPAHRYESAPLG